MLSAVRMMLGALPYTVVPADDSLARDAGSLWAATVRVCLSLGDRFCLAVARLLGVSAYTADRVRKDVAGERTTKVVIIR